MLGKDRYRGKIQKTTHFALSAHRLCHANVCRLRRLTPYKIVTRHSAFERLGREAGELEADLVVLSAMSHLDEQYVRFG